MTPAAGLHRRDLLLLRLDPERRTLELSCERLLMKLVDADLDGTRAQIFARLSRELEDVSEVRLTDTEWLARADLARDLEPVLDRFRARGGRVT
jgi:hypothetical protein